MSKYDPNIKAPKLAPGSESTHEMFNATDAEVKAFMDDLVVKLVEREIKGKPNDPVMVVQPIIEEWWDRWDLDIWERHMLIGYCLSRCFAIANRMKEAASGGGGMNLEALLEQMMGGSPFKMPRVKPEERKH